MISAIAFLAAGTAACAAVIAALFATVDMYYLSGARAISDDGLPRGSRVPGWTRADSAGRPLRSPPRAGFQLIVFADHSLKSFPSVADGLRALAAAGSGPQIVVLTRQQDSLTRPVLDALGLADVPVVTGSGALYGKYNVRVMPFMIFTDPAGRVRASSLVNHAWQVERLWRLAQVPPEAGGRPAVRAGRRPAGMAR